MADTLLRRLPVRLPRLSRRIGLCIGFATVLALGFGLRTSIDRRAWNSPDSWFHPPDYGRSGDGTDLTGVEIHLVAAQQMPLASELLRDVPSVAITGERASHLAGQPIETPEGKTLFLIRGVCLNRGSGRFSVSISDGNLFVHHGTLGRGPSPMERQALIVPLALAPEQVFVSCSMAE